MLRKRQSKDHAVVILYLQNESSGTEQAKNGHILTVVHDFASFYFKIIHIVQRDCGDFKIFESHVFDQNITIFIAMNAWSSTE